MKLNPLPWIKEWLAQPDEFWKAMNHFNEECDKMVVAEEVETTRMMDMEDALKLANELYGPKS